MSHAALVRVQSIDVLGDCLVCGAVVSCRRDWEQAHELEHVRCPVCRGGLLLDPETVFVTLEAGPDPDRPYLEPPALE